MSFHPDCTTDDDCELLSESFDVNRSDVHTSPHPSLACDRDAKSRMKILSCASAFSAYLSDKKASAHTVWDFWSWAARKWRKTEQTQIVFPHCAIVPCCHELQLYTRQSCKKMIATKKCTPRKNPNPKMNGNTLTRKKRVGKNASLARVECVCRKKKANYNRSSCLFMRNNSKVNRNERRTFSTLNDDSESWEHSRAPSTS